MKKIGILSDSHIAEPGVDFCDNVRRAFADCDIIVHAGDLTDIGILAAFGAPGSKTIHAVSGNCCNSRTQKSLPQVAKFEVDGIHFVVCHGDGGPRHSIEDRLFETFPEVDCIIYGHTHIPVSHMYGHILMVNPGSFKSTGIHGAGASYAIAEVANGKVTAKIMSL